jgi:putative DNA primase/helicase
MSTDGLKADPAEIRRVLEQLIGTDAVHGFVALKVKNQRGEVQEGGYYDHAHLAELVRQAARYSGRAESVCITLNPVKPVILAKRANRVERLGKGESTGKDAILRRQLFFVDIDAVRSGGVAGISATDKERAGARSVLDAVREYLSVVGWPDPLLVVDSGNGYWLLFRVDEPNDPETELLFTRALEALQYKFGVTGAAIDPSVATANRLIKIPGTLAAKGDEIEGRIHRIAQIIEEHPATACVTREQVAALAAEVPREKAPSQGPHQEHRRGNSSGAPFNLEKWLTAHAVPVVGEPHAWDSGPLMWEVEPCPFNSEHTGRTAFVGTRHDGAIVAGCQHSSCTWSWDELREKYEPGWRDRRSKPFEQSAPSASRRASLTSFSTIAPETLNWLWRDRFPLGKLSLLVGDPGLGKSLVTLYIAACISNGTGFADGAPCEQGSVIILSAEDGAADTVRPRLDALGADVTRIHRLTIHSGDDENLFNFDEDLKLLEATLVQLADVRAVIVDPMTAYLGETDPNKDSRVRSVLAPLSALAERGRVAVIGVMHLNKAAVLDAVYRVTGSVAFIAQARAAWVVAQDPSDSNKRLFLKLKANLSRANMPGLVFVLEGTGGVARVAWRGETDLNCRDVLGGFSNTSKRGRAETLDQARAILGEILADGPILSTRVFDEAKQRGVSKRSAERACKDLDVHSVRPPASGKWWKALPGECPGDGCPRCHTSREKSGGVEENHWGTRAKTNSAKGDKIGGLGTSGASQDANRSTGQDNPANYDDIGGVDSSPSRRMTSPNSANITKEIQQGVEIDDEGLELYPDDDTRDDEGIEP